MRAENVAECGNLPVHEDADTCLYGCHASVFGGEGADDEYPVPGRSTEANPASRLCMHVG